MKSPAEIGAMLLLRGKQMPRERLQKPRVHEWVAESGRKYWRAQWRQHIEGREAPKFRTERWPQSEYSKTRAQKLCDEMVAQEAGPMVADGALTVEQFWDRVHWPVLNRSLAPNSQNTYRTAWNKWIRPSIGKIELQRVSKNAAEVTLGKMAGMGEHTVRICRIVMSSLFTEAVENGFIQSNPARKVRLPRHKPTEETTPLTESEVRRLFAATDGQDRLLWMLLILLGLRISEALALKKDDITEDGFLRVDQSAHRGEGDLTKNRKKRIVPLPEILRIELEQWARQQPGKVLFPRKDGRMHDRNDNPTRRVQQRGREAAQLPRLTFRCCRTTFATLFDGDPRDLQEFLGHSTMQMTSRYRKVRAERQAASVEAMAERLSGKVVPISRKKKAGAGART